MIVRVIDHKSNELRAQAPGDGSVFRDSLQAESTSADLKLHSFIPRPASEPIQTRGLERVQREVVANLEQADAMLAALVDQTVFVQRMFRLMAAHANRPAEGVAAEAEADAGGSWFVVRGHCD